MIRCEFFDCGWCYAPDNVKTTKNLDSSCNSLKCPRIMENSKGNSRILQNEIEELENRIEDKKQEIRSYRREIKNLPWHRRWLAPLMRGTIGTMEDIVKNLESQKNFKQELIKHPYNNENN